jgi:hypothetical protein
MPVMHNLLDTYIQDFTFINPESTLALDIKHAMRMNMIKNNQWSHNKPVSHEQKYCPNLIHRYNTILKTFLPFICNSLIFLAVIRTLVSFASITSLAV